MEMQFTDFVLTVLLAIQSVLAASSSEEFGFLTIRSGSGLQYASIIAEGSRLYFGSGSNALSGSITNCGFLQFQDGSYAYEEPDGSFMKGSLDDATPGFRINSGSLEFQNGSFYGVKDNDQYRFSAKAASNDSLGVLIRAIAPKGNGITTVPDYTPHGTGPSCRVAGPAGNTTAANTTSAV